MTPNPGTTGAGRSMVENKIHDDADIVLPGIVCQMLKIFQRSVHGIDVFVIRNVVAEIDLRGRITGRDPDGVHPKILQIIQLGVDAVEIADPVSVTVGETTRVNLIEDRVLPPRMTSASTARPCARAKDRQGTNSKTTKLPL